jgi:hypothetical protein
MTDRELTLLIGIAILLVIGLRELKGFPESTATTIEDSPSFWGQVGMAVAA